MADNKLVARQRCTLVLTGGDKPGGKRHRDLQANGVVEFHWKKLRRRNGGIKEGAENHLCSSLPGGLSRD